MVDRQRAWVDIRRTSLQILIGWGFGGTRPSHALPKGFTPLVPFRSVASVFIVGTLLRRAETGLELWTVLCALAAYKRTDNVRRALGPRDGTDNVRRALGPGNGQDPGVGSAPQESYEEERRQGRGEEKLHGYCDCCYCVDGGM